MWGAKHNWEASIPYAPPRSASRRSASRRSASRRIAPLRSASRSPAEDGPAEVRLAEVRQDAGVLVTPCVPSSHALLEHRDMLVVRHGSTLSATTLFCDG